MKGLLTKIEEHLFKDFLDCKGGYLRDYTKTHYRLLDKDLDPVRNVRRSLVKVYIEKGYLKLLKDHKFELL